MTEDAGCDVAPITDWGHAPTDAEALDLYERMVMFVVRHGLRREEPMSGWWWSEKVSEEQQLGFVVEELLMEVHKIDTRSKVEGEPMKFWGGDRFV